MEGRHRGRAGAKPGFPIIADDGLAVSKAFDMLPAEAYLPEGRTPADSQTVRSVFIVGPDKKLKLTMTYPMNVGRNFAEVLRALDGLQTAARENVATPADWVPGRMSSCRWRCRRGCDREVRRDRHEASLPADGKLPG
jgi:alkyl hydroperoxide reductase subunit AhpC